MRVVHVGLIALASSGCCLDYWGEVDEQPALADERLHDVVLTSVPDGTFAIGSGGRVFLHGEPFEHDLDVEWLGIARGWDLGDIVMLLGESGTVARWRSNLYNDQTGWKVMQVPGSPDLYAAADRLGTMFVVGDDVLARVESSGSVVEVEPPPAGGWGSLRAVIIDEFGNIALGGEDGVIWVISREGEDDAPTRIDLGIDSDIRAGGVHPDSGYMWLVGSEGLAVYAESLEDWREVDSGTTADFIDFAAGAALTDEGELWDVWRGRMIIDLPWARGIGESDVDYDDDDGDPHEDRDVLIVGDDGRFARLDGC